MHIVKFFTTGFACSCGTKENTITGAQARRHTYLHARKHSPAIMLDCRGCSQECIDNVDRGKDADPEVWHHLDCPNHTMACCPGRETEETLSAGVTFNGEQSIPIEKADQIFNVFDRQS